MAHIFTGENAHTHYRSMTSPDVAIKCVYLIHVSDLSAGIILTVMFEAYEFGVSKISNVLQQ